MVNAVRRPAPEGMTALDSGFEDGIQWAIVTAPFYGAVNGYALLPEGHSWRDLDLEWEDYQVCDVHGCITYSDEDGWIGFDTNHAGDIWPGTPHYGNEPWRYEVRWTKGLATAEARELARQIAAAS